MEQKNAVDRYVDYLNKHILPKIDFNKLQKSYKTDMVYAKETLGQLHDAMMTCYGSEHLDEFSGDEGFVLVPRLVRGKETGNVCLALLDLDLSSSGEHWGTDFFCDLGLVSQSRDLDTPAGKAMQARIGVYDYCYTATIPGDIHVDQNRLPAKLKSALEDFRSHREALAMKKGQKPSLRKELREKSNGIKAAEKRATPSKKSELDR